MSDKPDEGRGERQLDEELQRFAADLSRLRPREDRLDRERLAFLAGQASVTRKSVRPIKVLGLPLESRAWPAAFVSMTAIAAALLFALLVRPESPSPNQIATNGHVNNADEQLSIEPSIVPEVLTTRDAHMGDIQSRLAKRDVDRMDGNGSIRFPDVRDVPILTPNAWHQVINNSEQLVPSADDSSSPFQNRGATL
jgi:hypothetical protein